MPGGERKARDDIRYYPRLQRGGLSGLLSGRCAALRPRRFRAAAGQRRLHRPQPGNLRGVRPAGQPRQTVYPGKPGGIRRPEPGAGGVRRGVGGICGRGRCDFPRLSGPGCPGGGAGPAAVRFQRNRGGAFPRRPGAGDDCL